MAGGSADAAATLVALDRLWELETSDEDLLAIAARLGSDVPFALLGGTAGGTGRGEVVEPLPDTGSWWWVGVGSDVGLSTPEVYRAFDELSDLTVLDEPFLPPDLLMSLAEGSLIALPAQLQNDLQEAALSLRPDLVRTFDDGYEAGAMECLLSGSGPTVLLLCSDADHAREVTAAMHAAGHPRTVAVPAPVSGVHVVSYDGGPVGCRCCPTPPAATACARRSSAAWPTTSGPPRPAPARWWRSCWPASRWTAPWPGSPAESGGAAPWPRCCSGTTT